MPFNQWQGHNSNIFLRGQLVIFPNFFPGVKCCFPVENSHFGRPKTNFSGSEKWKAKKTKQNKTKQNKTKQNKTNKKQTNKQKTKNKKTKKERKEKVLYSCCNFFTLNFQFSTFPFTILQFSFFSSQFSRLSTFFFASFFPVGQQKFPGSEVSGGGVLCPSALPPPAPSVATPLISDTVFVLTLGIAKEHWVVGEFLHHQNFRGALECQGISGSSKNSCKKGPFSQLSTYVRNVNRVSNPSKIGLKCYHLGRSYVFRVVFHAKFV